MLLDQRRIRETARTPTRGGSQVPVYVPADQRRKTRKVSEASARKRLLYARYIGWAQTTAKRPSLIGRAGERVAHSSLLDAASAGYRVDPSIGNVRTLLGRDVPGGPLDFGAHLITLNNGVPGPTITIAGEVKNIREWIYPQAPEIFQLLDKAATLQVSSGAQILPVLVCRRVHYTAGLMAKQLGFFIASANSQFILPHEEADERLLSEVRDELGFKDLERRERSHPLLLKYFRDSIPLRAAEMARTFCRFAPILVRHAHLLREDSVRGQARIFYMDRLCEELAAETSSPLGWR